MKGKVTAVVVVLMVGFMGYSLWSYFTGSDKHNDNQSGTVTQVKSEPDSLEDMPNIDSVEHDMMLFLSVWDEKSYGEARADIPCSPEINAKYFNGTWGKRYCEYTSKPEVELSEVGSTIPEKVDTTRTYKYFVKAYLSYNDIGGKARMKTCSLTMTYVNNVVVDIVRRDY